MPNNEATSWRSYWTNIALAVPVILVIVFFISYEGCDAACADWDYVEDLLLDDGQSKVIHRWDYGPSVTISNGNSQEVDMVIGAVYEVNQLLLNTNFALRFTWEESADIKVTFGSRNELNKSNPNYQIDSNIEGYIMSSVEHDGTLNTASIFVVRNLTPGDKWGTVLHELGHAVGIIGHTDRYYSSLFHINLKGGALSDGFSSDDRKLLSFLYQHLKPGAKEPEVRAAFAKHWVTRSN